MAHIFQINISAGGVPKLPVPRAEVTSLGLGGDAHHNTKVHGGPRRALCLYSLERLLALQAEGHPIFPGATGENLTITGLLWDVLTPGARLCVGADVLLEITGYTAPCPKIVESFVGGDIRRMSQEAHPGWSRLYAQVLTPGVVNVGDPVVLEAREF